MAVLFFVPSVCAEPLRDVPLNTCSAGTEEPERIAVRNELRVRILSINQDFHFESRPFTLSGELEPGFGTPSKWSVFAGDANGDEKTDLLIQSAQSRALGFGLSDGRGVLIKAMPATAFVPATPLEGVVVGESPGSCARFLVAPAAQNEALAMFGWKPHSGFQAEPAGPLVRRFEKSRFGLVNAVEEARRIVYEADADASGAVAVWRYTARGGWENAPSAMVHPLLLPSTYLGARPFREGVREQRGFFVRPDRQFTELLMSNATATNAIFRLEGSALKPRAFAGDFNGDGRGDFLVFDSAGSARSSWIVLSFHDTVLAKPLPGFNEFVGADSLLASGDFDGDGRDELLAGAPSSLRLISIVPPELPLQRIGLEVNGVPMRLDASGGLSIDAPPGKAVHLRVTGDNIRALEPETTILPQSGLHRIGIFVETGRESADGRIFDFGFNPDGPFVCTGLLHTSRGEELTYSTNVYKCPKGYAAINTNLGRSTVFMNCCRLPDDMLVDAEEAWAPAGICPYGSILTGFDGPGFQSDARCGRNCPLQIRCTPVNLNRYEVQPSSAARYFGERNDLSDEPRLSRMSFPPGLVVGIAHALEKTWDGESCVPREWGAVLTGRTARGCANAYFARILPKDPAERSAVSAIFPFRDCKAEPDPFDASKGCEAREREAAPFTSKQN